MEDNELKIQQIDWFKKQETDTQGINLNDVVNGYIAQYKNTIVGNTITKIFKNATYHVEVWVHLPSNMHVITITCVKYPDGMFTQYE